jgi:hypothetical protein
MTVPTGTRLVAVLLIIGGSVGAAISLWAEARAYAPADLRFVAAAMVLFGCSVWVGVRLWQGRPNSYRWAQALFLLQIPNITVPGFSYQFYLGLTLVLSFSREAASKLNLDFEIASGLTFKISSEIENLVVGINLVALGILIYLLMKSREEIPQKPLAGSDELEASNLQAKESFHRHSTHA